MKLVLSLLILDYVLSEDALPTKGSEEFVPCDEGWYYFRERCYKAGSKNRDLRFSWFDSEANCKKDGGFVVGIRSREELDFIVTFLLMDIKRSAWIGLNDQAEEGTYEWHDGSPNNFTNWRWGEPTGTKFLDEDCTLMLYEPEHDAIGIWNDVICPEGHGYICHKNINKEQKSPNPMSCVSNGHRGVKYRSSCYHVVTEKKSWQDAERHCKDAFDGHLVTILDNAAEMLLDYLLLSCDNKDIWIGINTQGQTQLKWTSGWFVSYDGMNTRHGAIEGTCVVRKKKKEWVLAPCTEEYPFVCERLEVNPPVLKSPPNSHCPKTADGWKDLGGDNCYFFETASRLSWYEAKFDCLRRGGNLVSIHSKEEKDVLLPFIVSQNKPIHLGLVRLLSLDFAWSDGSARDYNNWSEGEPNNPEKKCSEIHAGDGTWNDANCKDEQTYICSVRKIIQSTTKVDKTTATRDKSHVTQSSTKADEVTVLSATPGSKEIHDFTVFFAFNSTEKISEITDSGDLVLKFVIGISVCIALVVFLLVLTVYYFRQWVLEKRKNSRGVRVTPPPIWTIPSRRWAGDDGYTYKDDENYEIMR